MNEQMVPVSEMRDHIAEYVDGIDYNGRVMITKNGKERAYLIGVRELRALEETVAVLENTSLLNNLRQGLEDIKAGRVQEAREAFLELDAEFKDED